VHFRAEDLELLKKSLVMWLKESPETELKQLAQQTASAQISESTVGYQIGEWSFDSVAKTLTRFGQATRVGTRAGIGWDLVFHVRKTSDGWEKDRFEVIEVRHAK
jgi:hypothetical protein